MLRFECRRCGHQFDSSDSAARVRPHRNSIPRATPAVTVGDARRVLFCPKCGKRVSLHGTPVGDRN